MIPPKSRREAAYLRVLRPLLARVLNVEKHQPNFRGRVDSISAPRFHKDKVEEILVIKCDHVGDFVLSLPALSLLRKGFQDARITLLCGPWNKDLAERTGLFDRVVCIEIFFELSGLGVLPFDSPSLTALGLPCFDIAIDLRVEQGSQFLLGYVDAKFKAAFDSDAYAADRQASYERSSAHYVFPVPFARWNGSVNHARHAQVLLTSFVSGIINRFAAYEVGAEVFERVMDGVQSIPVSRRGLGPIIGISIRSRAAIRDWPLENYRVLIGNLVAKHDATIVLLGSSDQERGGAELSKGISETHVVSLIGKTSLIELSSVIKQLALFVGHDTGSTHLAGVLGQKTLCLHAGVTLLEAYGPTGPNVVVLKCFDLDCSPCYLVKRGDCRNDHRCMRAITPERVIDEIERMLSLQVRPDTSTDDGCMGATL
jgi:ADP-heptose:LPS heptosyltransferase